jgi:hypothetical protein
LWSRGWETRREAMDFVSTVCTRQQRIAELRLG